MIDKDFITYELALELKQLGFDESCLGSYYHAGKKLDIPAGFKYINHGEYTVLAPTYSQAFRWFREKFGYNCFIPTALKDNKWYYFIENLNDRTNDSEPEFTPKFKTYEEAELACLRKLIEIVKGGNK
jgi:hypothetical protein